MAKKIYKEALLDSLPDRLNTKYLIGHKVKVKSGNRFKSYILDSNRQWLFDQGITDEQEGKLNGLKTQSQIDAEIQGARTYTDQKVLQTVGETIPITGTVLPQGPAIPSWVTTTGKAQLLGGSLGKTYTQTGGSPIAVTANYMRYAYYNKTTNIWTQGEEIELPKGADGKMIADWTAKVYSNGDQVFYDNKVYQSNAATLASDVPGISSKWDVKVSSVKLNVAGGAAGYERVQALEENKGTPIIYLGSNPIYSIPGYVNTAGNFADDPTAKRTDYLPVFKGDKITVRCKTATYAIRFYDKYKEAKGGVVTGTTVAASLQEAVFIAPEDGYVITSNSINAQIPSIDNVWIKIESTRFLEKDEKGRIQGVALFDDVEKLLSKSSFGERTAATDYLVFNVDKSYVQPNKVITDTSATNFRRTSFRRVLKGQTIRVRTSISVCCIALYDDNFVLSDESLVTGQSSWQTPEGGQTLQIGELTATKDGWFLISHTAGGTVVEKYIYFEISNGIVQSKSQTDTKGGAASHERVSKIENTTTSIDKSHRTPYRYPSRSEGGAICIIDDDGAKAFYDYLLPYMMSRGLPIATAIVPNWIKPHRYIYETAGIFIPIMTMSEVADVALKVRTTNLVEMLCHTWNHDFFVNTRTEQSLREDVEKCMAWFNTNFKIKPKGIVYPAGRHDDFCMRIASGSFDYGFNTAGTGNIARRVNRIGTLRNHTLNRVDFGGNSAAVDFIKDAITDAKNTNGLVVITTHWKGYNQYATDQADWEALCDWIIASGVKVLLPSDAFAAFGNMMEADNGFKISAKGVITAGV